MPHISCRKAASARALGEIKDVTPGDAAAIRAAWQTIPNRREARTTVDRILRTFGVEFLGIHRRTRESVYYCNAGDTYACTVLFVGPRLRVGCWGDLVERNAIREPTMNDRS
jgi:hypothetical protein